jgi:pyruvate carboxylase
VGVPHSWCGHEPAFPRPGHHASEVRDAEYTTKFIDETPELFKWEKKRDRATRILTFIGETIVNGNPEVKGA